MALNVLADNLLFLVNRGIVDDHLKHETVDLSLGQLIGAFLLNGVLRCHHKERIGQLERILTDGDLMLLHGFKQCALHLGGSTVDLIGQHEVGKHGTLLHMEALVFLRIDQGTDDVGRKQVGGELDAREIGINELSQSLDG